MKTNNRLIAEFMGCVVRTDSPTMKVWLNENDGTSFYCEWHPDYAHGTNVMAWVFAPDKNWCQLMPVVEKISRIRCAPDNKFDLDTFYLRTFGMIDITTGEFMVRINRFSLHQSNSFIEATYQAVVEFIEWYNEQEK